MTTGLEGVAVCQTVLSDVDGARGRLIVRGAPIEALAGHVPFEALAARLWQGIVPGEEGDVAATAARIGRGRARAFEALRPVLPLLAGRPPLEALRWALAALPDGEDAH